METSFLSEEDHIIKRVPRAMGVTELSNRFNGTKDENDYQNLVERVVKSFALNNFRFMGKSLSITEFSLAIKVPEQLVIKRLGEMGNSMSLAQDAESLKSLHSLIGLKVIENGFHIYDEISRQVEILRESQGDSYKAFVTSTLNEALKMKENSNSQLMDNFNKIYQGGGKGGTNVLNLLLPNGINPDANDIQDAQEVMDVDKVLSIIANEDRNYGLEEDTESQSKQHIIDIGISEMDQPAIQALDPDNKKYVNPDNLEENRIFDMSDDELKDRNKVVLPQKITILPK